MAVTLKVSVLLLLAASFFRGSDAVGTPNHTAFCYSEDDPNCGYQSTKWGGICQTGTEQSPIDIEYTNAELEKADIKLFSMHESFGSESAHSFYAQNNGHSIQFEFVSNTSELKSNYSMTADFLTSTYTFAQLHFHWGENAASGSEHSITHNETGRKEFRYPLELHMVHYRSNYTSLANALSHSDDRDAVVVMGVFFQLGMYNLGLKPIVDVAKQLQTPGNVTHFNKRLNLKALYPHPSLLRRSQPAVAVYDGSLTTPTCDEKVKWAVFLDVNELDERQMSAIRQVLNEELEPAQNYRPTQPLNQRKLSLYRLDMTRNFIPRLLGDVASTVGNTVGRLGDKVASLGDRLSKLFNRV